MTVILRCTTHKKYSGINPPPINCRACHILYDCRRQAANASIFELFIDGDGGKPKLQRRKKTLKERLHLSELGKERYVQHNNKE
jgi:hypothetical protein